MKFFDIYTDDNKSAVDESAGLLKTDSYVGSDGGRYGGKPSAISTTNSRPPFVTISETSWLAMGKYCVLSPSKRKNYFKPDFAQPKSAKTAETAIRGITIR